MRKSGQMIKDPFVLPVAVLPFAWVMSVFVGEFYGKILAIVSIILVITILTVSGYFIYSSKDGDVE